MPKTIIFNSRRTEKRTERKIVKMMTSTQRDVSRQNNNNNNDNNALHTQPNLQTTPSTYTGAYKQLTRHAIHRKET